MLRQERERRVDLSLHTRCRQTLPLDRNLAERATLVQSCHLLKVLPVDVLVGLAIRFEQVVVQIFGLDERRQTERHVTRLQTIVQRILLLHHLGPLLKLLLVVVKRHDGERTEQKVCQNAIA